MAEPYVKPAIRRSETGLPARKRDSGRDERSGAPASPKTSGAPAPDGEPLKNPLANRNPGRRQDGMTPRPSDRPID